MWILGVGLGSGFELGAPNRRISVQGCGLRLRSRSSDFEALGLILLNVWGVGTNPAPEHAQNTVKYMVF